MSLNKRSLRKKAKPEPSLEEQLRAHERSLKSRRGSNRKAAFDAIRTQDEARAIAAVEAILVDTSGQNREELGALLVSTGERRFLDAALRGKYGALDVRRHASDAMLAGFVDDFVARRYAFTPAEAERRARMLAHDPRVLAIVLDEARFDPVFRREMAARALDAAPELLWQRRDTVDAALAIAAGLATHLIGDVDVDAFARSLAALSKAQRASCFRAAKLPASALRLPSKTRTALLLLALDDDGVGAAEKADLAHALARLDVDAATEGVVARPRVCPAATVVACGRLSAHEAHDVIAPLLREFPDARDAFLASRHAVDPIFVDDAVALLAVDFARARAMLERNASARAKEELAGLRSRQF